MRSIALIGTITGEPVLTQSERFLHFHVAAERAECDGTTTTGAVYVCTVFGESAAPLSQQLRAGQRVQVTGHVRPRIGPVERVAVASVALEGDPAAQPSELH